jgi:hypothetical protein
MMNVEAMQPQPLRPKNEARFPAVMALVIGLPILSVCFGAGAAYVAFVKGFTALPEQAPAAIVAPHR